MPTSLSVSRPVVTELQERQIGVASEWRQTSPLAIPSVVHVDVHGLVWVAGEVPTPKGVIDDFLVQPVTTAGNFSIAVARCSVAAACHGSDKRKGLGRSRAGDPLVDTKPAAESITVRYVRRGCPMVVPIGSKTRTFPVADTVRVAHDRRCSRGQGRPRPRAGPNCTS